MIEAFDLWLLRTLYAGGSDCVWRDLSLALTFLGSGWMLFGLIPTMFLQSMRTQSAALLLTTAATSGIVASIKALTGRVRPCNALDWVHPVSLAVPTDHSFPSGHAAGSFAFAVFILTANRRAGIVLIGVATAIALSRVALGVHYPSDVVAGALLGATLAWIGARMNARYTGLSAVGLTDADSKPVGQ